MPTIVARYFAPGPSLWQDFADVFAASVATHCPTWTLDLVRVFPGALSSPLGSTGNVYNTYKLEAWAAAVHAAADGSELLLTDVDLLIRRPLDALWREDFDLAYTTKARGSRFPFNAGVMALRVSAPVRAFVERWRATNRQMLDDALFHQVWRPGFGGINQASLGMLLTQGAHAGLVVHRLPCVEWNCEDESWPAFDPALTRIVHYKGDLQRALRRGTKVAAPGAQLLSEWRAVQAAIPRAPQHGQVTPGELTHRDAPAGDPVEDAPPREDPPQEDPPPPPQKKRRRPPARPEVQP